MILLFYFFIFDSITKSWLSLPKWRDKLTKSKGIEEVMKKFKERFKKIKNMITIISPDTGKKIQIAENDLEIGVNWNEAKKACNKLGKGWRLPTIEELKIMYNDVYLNGLKVGDPLKYNFNWVYWSISEFDADHAWAYFFDEDYAHENPKEYKFSLRAVRDLK